LNIRLIIRVGFLITLAYLIGYVIGTKKTGSTHQIVSNDQKTEKIEERIVKKVGGSEVTYRTIIKNHNSTKVDTKKANKNKDWLLQLTGAPPRVLGGEPILGLGVSYKILPMAFVGAYMRTDKEVGLMVTVEF